MWRKSQGSTWSPLNEGPQARQLSGTETEAGSWGWIGIGLLAMWGPLPSPAAHRSAVLEKGGSCWSSSECVLLYFSCPCCYRFYFWCNQNSFKLDTFSGILLVLPGTWFLLLMGFHVSSLPMSFCTKPWKMVASHWVLDEIIRLFKY